MRKALIVFSLTLFCSSAAAQGFNSPTQGVRLLSESVADGNDASILELNPAGIGFIHGWNFVFYHSSFKDLAGEGDSVFFSSRVIGPWTIGFGMQFMRWNEFGGDFLKFTITNALNIGKTFSIGFGYNFFIDDKNRDVHKLGSFDIGLIYRPWSFLSIGLAIKDIDTPLFKGKPLNRFYDFAIGLRPGDSPRYTLSLGVRVEERAATWDPYLSFRLEPLKGWVLLGQAGLLRRSKQNNFFLSFGMEFNFSLFGAGSGYHFQRMKGKNTHGFSTYFRISNRASRTLVQRSRIFPVIRIGGGLAEYNRTGLFATKRTTMFAMLYALNYYRLHPSVDGIVLKIEGSGLGWAQAEELRNALQAFKKAKKKVVVHIDSTNTVGYYLASAADVVAVNPAGGIYLTGLSTTLTFLKGVMSKLGIDAEFIRIGKYKSFPEVFTRRGPTGPNKKVRNSLLDGLYNEFINSVATSRGRTAKQVVAAIDKGTFLPGGLKAAGLVDAVLNYDQLRGYLKKRFKSDIKMTGRFPSFRRQPTHWSEAKEIAVIVIDGSIVVGNSSQIPLLGQKFTGSNTVKKLLTKIRSNRRIKAVVIRVNSGGGSALASDIMHRQILLTRKVKPVVVSFGNVAASGAYYLAAAANKIFASKTTITGSIGIFAGKFIFSGLFKLLGINRVIYKRGKYSTLFSIDRKYTADEKKLLLGKITHFYNIFLKRVATGRKLSTKAVDKVGRGRVWLGSQAKKHKLFDKYGSMWDAMMEARRLAGISKGERIRYRLLPEYSWWQRIRKSLSLQAKSPESLLSRSRRQLLKLLAPALMQFRPYEPLALLPFQIEIH